VTNEFTIHETPSEPITSQKQEILHPQENYLKFLSPKAPEENGAKTDNAL